MVNEENILMKALYDMDFERIKSILKQGFDVNEPYNKHGWTPFMWACKEFYEPDIIKAFIQAGGDVLRLNAVRRKLWRFYLKPEQILTLAISSAILLLYMWFVILKL